jgi:alpha-mannosidase
VLAGNGDQLQFLWEKGQSMSAWNISPITKTEPAKPAGIAVISYGPMSVLRVKHEYDKSSFTQDIILYSGVPRIDFRMTADWGQSGSRENGGPMLKVAFPLNVTDGKATYEIPFGSIERPANGDEVPGQKWIDVSGKDYGVSLLNDCKYGFDVNGNVMRMTLIRTPDDPDPQSDLGRHEINYSLYPHMGDWRQADTVRRGYELNNPLIPIVTTGHQGKWPCEHSFLQVEPSNIILTALKKAESGDGLILRLYECEGTEGTADISFGMSIDRQQDTDLVERDKSGSRKITNGRTRIPYGKWEIKALRLSRPDKS